MKYLFRLLMWLLCTTVYGQSIIGTWETYDDKTNEKKALIEIYKSNNLFFAKIVENYVGKKNGVCLKCKGTKKNKPIIGLVIIADIKKNGNVFDGGSILDPESGEDYNCTLNLINSNKLKVRGFLGFSIFGRTQYWLRK